MTLEAALKHQLKDEPGIVFWPRKTTDIPDDSMVFRVAYLPPEFGEFDRDELLRRLDGLHRFWGPTRRQFRNALAFVVPDAEAMHHANPVRPGCLYQYLALPRRGEGHGGNTEFEFVELAAQATHEIALHALVLNSLDPYLRDDLKPEEIIQIIGLGLVDCASVQRALFPLADVARWIFSFLSLPRLRSVQPIQEAISKGVRERKFGLLHTEKLLELDLLPEDLIQDIEFGTEIDPGRILFAGDAYLVWADAVSR